MQSDYHVPVQELVHLPYEALYAAASELNAKDLCVLAGAGLEKHTLATLAEDLGSTLPTSTCLDFLLLLLNDSRQIVREGAARGLAAHVSSPQAAAALTTALVNEPSPALRDLVSLVLKPRRR